MSKKRGKEISLSEKLSSLIQAKPSAIESDDDDLVTVDKIAAVESGSECSADELDVSEFRRLNNGLLEEDDKKYSGKGICRKDLGGSIDSDVAASEADACSDAGDSFAPKSDSERDSDGVDEEVDEEDEEESGEEIQTDDKTKLNKSKQQDRNFNKEVFLKAASDIEKGKAIRNQLYMWDFLLECRMKFQKCLAASNRFPSYKDFPKFSNKENPSFQGSVVECRKSLKHLLNSLLSLQQVLLKLNEDYSPGSNCEAEKTKHDDEEVLSDSEKDASECSSNLRKKFRKLSDFSAEISKRHSEFQNYKNNTIQKWNDKTRIGYISNKNFSAFEQSTLKQIELVLLDKQRLIKRTQTKRSAYHVLGEDENKPPSKKHAAIQPEEDSLVPAVNNKNRLLYKEIFDDDDFYHQLLSEIVKRKANDVTDPLQLGRQWMQLQKIRSKMKKTVDAKASKGRKVRFVVHPKLVNFMMPVDNLNCNEESNAELFNSLFGKTKK